VKSGGYPETGWHPNCQFRLGKTALLSQAMWRASDTHFREHTDASALPEGVVSLRRCASCDEWQQLTIKTEKREKVNLS
jgi:hypothetical protein